MIIDEEQVMALILAAGYSSRMDRFKPLAMLGSMTALERCVILFADCGIEDVLVVVGHRHDEITRLIDQRLNARHVLNSRFHEGMFSSVKTGLSSLEYTPKAFFILPVDIPLVSRNTIHRLVDAFDSNRADVYYPCFRGRRGHPPLISGSLIKGILDFSGDGGLRGYLKDKTALNVEVPDEHILMDMDVPAQYFDLVRRLENSDAASDTDGN